MIYRDVKNPERFDYVKYYQVNNIVFKVSFLSENELSLIHPKFSHLEIEKKIVIHTHLMFLPNIIILF